MAEDKTTAPAEESVEATQAQVVETPKPVSYTHLTLPTIQL